MKAIINFKNRFPILLSLIITGCFFGVLIGTGRLLNLLRIPDLNSGGYTAQAAGEAAVAVFALLCLWLIGELKTLRRGSFGKGLACGTYLLVIIALNVIMQLYSVLSAGSALRGVAAAVFFILTMFLIGFAEETVFRGAISTAIFEKYATDYSGAWFSVIVSGLLFGAMHMINGITLGSFDGVFVQCVAAMAMGMMLTAVYYRSGSLWAVIFLHAALDFAALLSGMFESSGSIDSVIGSYSSANLVAVFPYIGVTAFLMRPSKMKPIVSYEPSSERSKIRLIIGMTAAVMFFIACSGATIAKDIARFIAEGGWQTFLQ